MVEESDNMPAESYSVNLPPLGCVIPKRYEPLPSAVPAKFSVDQLIREFLDDMSNLQNINRNVHVTLNYD